MKSNSCIGKLETSLAFSSTNSENFDESAAPVFPIKFLPDAVRSMAEAICEVERIPASLAGVCTLGILSASIGRNLQVRSGPQRFTRGNLYIIASAESGSGKSETFRHAAKPLYEFERDHIRTWTDSSLPNLQSEHEIIEMEIAKLRRKVSSSNLDRDELKAQLTQKKADLLTLERLIVPPVLTVEDVTTEKLATLLFQRAETLASLSADAGAVVNNLLGRYSKLERTDESIYLKAFSGDSCRVDRQSRAPVSLESPCLTALWLTQPDKVETLLAERSLTDGGLIPRILLCHTNCQPRPIAEQVQPIPLKVEETYRSLIHELIKGYRISSKIQTVEPNTDALNTMNDHFNMLVERRLNDLADITSFVARWNENAWRIAVCLHAGNYGSSAHKHHLEHSTVQQALTISEWFAGQQLQILSAGRRKVREETFDKVLSLLADKPQGITARDVQRKRIKADSKSSSKLLSEMEHEGILVRSESIPKTGGNISQIYTKKLVNDVA